MARKTKKAPLAQRRNPGKTPKPSQPGQGVALLTRDKLKQLGRLLGAWLHGDFYDKLRELKERYAPLDPDADYVTIKNCSRARTERSDEEFLVAFENALIRANYRPLARDVIEKAVSAHNEMGLTYIPDFDLFEHLRVYVRGYTQICRECRSLRTRFAKKRVTLDAYSRMVIALACSRSIAAMFGPAKDESRNYFLERFPGYMRAMWRAMDEQIGKQSHRGERHG